MNILIIEDEARIAKRLQRMTEEFFGGNAAPPAAASLGDRSASPDAFGHKTTMITVCDSLQKGLQHISAHPVDLLLLDLNLNGDNGFELLELMVAGAFHTIIVSANTDKAITAFDYGVLDFVPKPFDQERLFRAFRRFVTPVVPRAGTIKYLAVKTAGVVRLIDITTVVYIKGAGIYTELRLQNGTQELHDKSLELLEQLLPPSFERIHKSYLVNLAQADKILVQPGTRYHLQLKTGEMLPIGRSRYKQLRDKMI